MTDTNQALQALLMAGQGKATQFPPTSRYYGIDTATVSLADGRTAIYLRRRFFLHRIILPCSNITRSQKASGWTILLRNT